MRVGYDPKNGNIKTDVSGVVVDRAFIAHFAITAPGAADTDAVLTLTNLSAVAASVASGINAPDVPRALSITGNVSGITGDVVITGTNYNGDTITETIALNGTATVHGAKAFKTITQIDLPVQVHTPTQQVETATVVGDISTSGNAEVIVTAAGMGNSPKTFSVPVLQGVAQVETATVVGSITTSGDVETIVTAAGMGNSTKAITTAVAEGTAQVETATVALDGAAITTSGDAEVIVTALGMTNTPKTVSVAVVEGTSQVETAEIVGTIGPAGAGDAEVIITAAAMAGSPKTINVAVANDDSAEQVAGKIRTALGLDGDVTAVFTVGGSGTYVSLTVTTPVANDATINIAIDNGTCSGLTAVPTSTDTTLGVVPDDVNSVATKIRAALTNDADANGFFVVSGTNASVVLTARTKAANDGNLNISIADDTCAGITTAATSAQTTPGVAQDTAASVANKIRTDLGNDADVAAFFTVSGANENIILTAIDEAANDATMNIAIDNDTCAGLTAVPTSANTVAGVAPDDASAIANKIRTALSVDNDVVAFFTVGGSGATVVLTAITPAANDATVNIAVDNDTSVGITPAANSANTAAGVAYDKVSVGYNDKLGLPYKLSHNTVLNAFLNDVLEGTAPTVTVDASDIEANTMDLNSSLDGTQVDAYLIV